MDLLGKTLGNYKILEEVGRGGMATVYRAYQTSLNRPVAIKVLAGELARDTSFRERFQREAHAVAQLAHPNILPVYDFGEDTESGIVYLVTQFVDGGVLTARMQTAMPPKDAVRIAVQLARALDHAHAAGIVHRDVKPGNVLMTRDGHPLLSDFGIAKVVNETRLTRTGASMGTPQYMSPEQALGLPVDHRSDIYALGVMLYEMLSGTLPFQADTPVALLHQHAHEPPPPLRERAPLVSKGLEKIVMRALAKDPNERFATAGEFANALEDEITGRRKLFPLKRPRAEAVPSAPSPHAATMAEGELPLPARPSPIPSPPVSTARLRTPAYPVRVTTQQKVLRATKGVGRWLLRAGLVVLAALIVIGIILLVGGSFVLGAIAEQSIASQRWVFSNVGPGYKESVSCADIRTGMSQALRPYTLDALTDVDALCLQPDSVEVSGKFRGSPISLRVRIYLVKGVPAIQLERFNDKPLYIIGGILSDGVNRGMNKAWANASVRIGKMEVTYTAIEIVYEANP